MHSKARLDPVSAARRPRVLIVGAGIAGLALARTLADTAVSLDVVEREAQWRPAGTGLYLPGNATRALRELGLEAEVVSRAVEIVTQRVFDHRGRLIGEVDVTEVWAAVGPCLAIGRAELHDVLLRAVGDTPIHLGLTVERLTQEGGVVSVEFSDGSSGEYDLVVAADGINSATRRLAFDSAAPPRPLGQIAWRFLAPCDPEAQTWSLMLGRRTGLLTLPIGGGRMYCYCDALAPPASHDAEHHPLERPQQIIAEFGDPAGALLNALDATTDVHVARIKEVVLDTWARGHVVLIGDAAHATSPNMAEGAAMALEDALVLGTCLRATAAIPAALAAFETRRRPRTDWVRAQTRHRDRTRYLPAAVRNHVLRALGRRIYEANYRPLFEAC